MPSNHLIFCRPLLLPPSVFPSIRVFSSGLVLQIRSPKYWSFSFSISPSNKYSGLISFRIDWLDPLADQGTLNSFLQHHSSKASVLRCSAFFIVQLSHPYMTTGKTIALSRWTFVGKVMSLSFFWEICMQVMKQQLEPDMEQSGYKLGKEYVKAIYCHPAYLTYVQSTSCKMLGWMKHKPKSRLLGEISITSDIQMTRPLWQKARREESLDESERGEWKNWLRTQHSKS